MIMEPSKHILIFIIKIIISVQSTISISPSALDDVRRSIINAEMTLATGGSLWLTAKEQNANHILMTAKRKEMEIGLEHPEMYPPAMHFFQAKPLIRQSEVFRIIRKMPKGALLHGHNTGMVPSKWVIQNLTAQFNVQMCRDAENVLLFTLRNNTKCRTPLTNICNARQKTRNVLQFNKKLERHITMFTTHPEIAQLNTTGLWKRFENIFETVSDLYKYVPAFRAYHKKMLEELYEDNIFYAEIRIPLSSLYGTDKTYTALDVAEELYKISEEFKRVKHDFLGIKVIYAKRNTGTNKQMATRIEEFKELRSKMPNFVIGFDLIGQEDIGQPLQTFINELSEVPNDKNFFFHAGETNWYGRTDWNILDAILLNTRRIGHGYALTKHPQLWEAVKQRDIAIEINPISNQVLRFIWDLRNHPASFFISENIPIVISSDDPGLWGSRGLSFDYYYAFMAFASVEADLRILKQLALNSIKYSILTPEERRKANNLFQVKWNVFIDDVIESRY